MVPLPTSKKMFFLWDPRILGMQAGARRLCQVSPCPPSSPKAVLGERPTQPGLNGWVGGSGVTKKCLPLIGELVSMVTD